jgi:ABC-type transporter Mla MlaB component
MPAGTGRATPPPPNCDQSLTRSSGSVPTVSIRTLTFHIAQRPGVITLSVVGEIDSTTIDQLVNQGRAVLADTPPLLVLNFAQVPFVDSPGLTGLLNLRTIANTKHA